MDDFDDKTVPDTRILETDAGGRLVRRRIRARVVDGPDLGAEGVLEKESLIVGSGAGADLVLTDRRVSRLHVELAPVPSGVRVRDLGSRNGTFHGEAKVGALVVPLGSRVRIGKTVLELSAADEPLPLAPSERDRFGEVIAVSAPMRRLFAVLEEVAPTRSPVLLMGEAGVGKTALARAIHAASERRGPLELLDLSLAPSSETLDAALASSGTVVLEHVERAPSSLAEHLRSALERGVPARLVATARQDLRALVEAGAFSRDLFFQLGAVRLVVPPLFDRPEDVPLLVATFSRGREVPEALLDELRASEWEGNVRRLRAVVEAAFVGKTGEAETLGFREAKQQVMDGFEREYLRQLLDDHAGNVSAAARAAGMSRSHLITLLERHGLRGYG